MKKKYPKKYQKALEAYDRNTFYTIDEAVDVLLKTSVTKFDSTCEVHLNTGIDVKNAEHNLRGTIDLPQGTGKTVKIIAFVSDDKIKEAKEAGAIEAGEDELIEKISKGWMEFDVVVAMPDVMKKLGKIAKTLGQKGLMPNPKSGTISPQIGDLVSKIKKGKIEYRNDKDANLHNIFGKVSFGKEKLTENLKAYLKSINEAKPSSFKGTFLNTITLATTMGPGVKIDVTKAMEEIK